MKGLKIKLDNLDDRDGCVLITTTDRLGAIADQSIAGTMWEVPADMNEAYAMPPDHPGLLEELKAEGYDIDDSEYCPPDPIEEIDRSRAFSNQIMGELMPAENDVD